MHVCGKYSYCKRVIQMSNLVLKIEREKQQKEKNTYVYRDIDAFSDKYASSKVDVMIDVEAVKASIKNIFMWNTGEEVLYPGFGNSLRRFLYKPLDQHIKNQIAEEVKRAVEENEPRAVIDSLAVDEAGVNDDFSAIRLVLQYHVVGRNGSSQRISDTITITGNNGAQVKR